MATSRRLLPAALLAVAALVGLSAVGRWLQSDLDRPKADVPSTLQPTDQGTSTSRPPAVAVVRKVADIGPISDIAVDGNAIWVAAGGRVFRVDPENRRTVVVSGIRVSQSAAVRLAVGADSIWAATTTGRGLFRIDPRTARVSASLSIPAQGIAIHASDVWTVCCAAGVRPGTLTRLDPRNNRVLATVRLPGRPRSIGVGSSGVWILDDANGLLWRVDPQTNRLIATIRLPSRPVDPKSRGGEVAVTKDAVLVSDPAVATVRRIDPGRNELTVDSWEADGSDLAVADTEQVVWATSDVRLLGLMGHEVRGPRRGLHELNTDRITAVASAPGGVWLGTAEALFWVSLREA